MKLSGLQVFWLMFTFETGNLILLSISPAMQGAKEDIWIAYLIASILGVLIVYIATKTALLYPNHTFVQFCRCILGKWLGTVVVIIYFFQWYSLMPVMLKQSADFLNTVLLPDTPLWALIIPMILLFMYVTNIGGIEGIGRCSEVFGPIIMLSVVSSVVLLLKDFDIHNLMPVVINNGALSIWKGALDPLSILGESILMLMLVSFMNEPMKAVKSAVWGILLSAILVSIIAISVLLTFGPEISAKMLYPAFDMVSYISAMGFIQNVEIVGVLVWALSVFIKLSLYFFLICYATAQLFKIKNWRKMIWITSPFFFILTMLIPDSTYTFSYVSTYWFNFVLPVNMAGIPILLLIIGSIRKRFASGH